MSWLLGVLPALLFGVVAGMIVSVTGEDALLTYGPLGIISATLLWFAKGTVDRLIKDRDQANQQRDQMVNDVLTEIMPVLRRTVDVLEKQHQIDIDVLAVLKNVQRYLE